MIEVQEMDTTPIDGPWQLPHGWEWVRLGDVCTINPPRPRLKRNYDTPTSFIPMTKIDEIRGVIEEVETKPYAEVMRGFTYFEENDVLFAKITPSMQNGKCAIAHNLIDDFGFGSTEFHVLRPSHHVISEWAYYYLRRLQFRLDAKEHFLGAVGQQRVPEDFLTASLIPLPLAIDLQHRIVKRIESLLADLREAQNTLESMRQDINQVVNAASLEIFREVTANEKSVPLATMTTKIGSGSTPRGAHYEEIGVPFIRSLNVLWNKFSDRDLKFINPVVHRHMRGTEVQAGDVLLNITGASIGRSCCPPEYYLPANVNQHVSIIRPKHGLISRFLMYWLTNSETQEIIDNLQSGATRQALTKAQIAQFQIPLPDPTIQEQIVSYLDSAQEVVDGLQNIMHQDEEILQQVEQGILNQAFRGEL